VKATIDPTEGQSFCADGQCFEKKTLFSRPELRDFGGVAELIQKTYMYAMGNFSHSTELRGGGCHIQQLKDVLQTLEAAPLSQADLLRHTDCTNRTAFGLVGAGLDSQIHPGLITNVLLYYWLRLSTINANVPETFFQRLERHWEAVVERVEAFVEQRASFQHPFGVVLAQQ
jgi:hypothetical protein